MRTIVVLNKDQMGGGAPDLGQRLLKTFLQKARALRGLKAIVLYNSGVRLLASGSPVLAELTLLEEDGVLLHPCGTCLDHYRIEPAIGEVHGMDDILRALDTAAKVITL